MNFTNNSYLLFQIDKLHPRGIYDQEAYFERQNENSALLHYK